jgi:hypothetical protein
MPYLVAQNHPANVIGSGSVRLKTIEQNFQYAEIAR